jgi:hypothetical protein
MSTASLPFSYHMDAEFEPTAMRRFFSSRGRVTTVTPQKMTPQVGLSRPWAKRGQDLTSVPGNV